MTDRTPNSPALVDRLALIGGAGTNKVMAGELSRLVKRAFDAVRLPEPKKEGQGAVLYPFHREVAALAVRYHRTSSRVLWDLYESPARRLEPLYDDLLAAVLAETRPWLRDGLTFSIHPGATHEFPAGGRQLVGVLKNALIDAAAQRGIQLRVKVDDPDLHFVIRCTETHTVASLDLAGQSMNLRGYRTDGGGAAPLRETLAATVLFLSRYDARTEVLVDPMSGSGTLPIEGACLAQARPVWVPPRVPAAAHMPMFADLFAEPSTPLFEDTRPVIFANELDQRTHSGARANMARAGVAGLIETSCGDFRHVQPDAVRRIATARGYGTETGLIVCNPPYGERLAPSALLGLYRDLGIWCRKFPGWRAGFIVANPEFEVAFGGLPRIKKPLSNANLRGYFYLYDL